MYPGTVGIPGIPDSWLGWLSSRPVRMSRKCSRGWIRMPRAAARVCQRAGRLLGRDLGLECLFPLGEGDVALLEAR